MRQSGTDLPKKAEFTSRRNKLGISLLMHFSGKPCFVVTARCTNIHRSFNTFLMRNTSGFVVPGPHISAFSTAPLTETMSSSITCDNWQSLIKSQENRNAVNKNFLSLQKTVRYFGTASILCGYGVLKMSAVPGLTFFMFLCPTYCT